MRKFIIIYLLFIYSCTTHHIDRDTAEDMKYYYGEINRLNNEVYNLEQKNMELEDRISELEDQLNNL